MIGDWYLASTEIWEKTLGLSWKDNLCLSCLEKRLGRPLIGGICGDCNPASSYPPPFRGISDKLKALWGPLSGPRARKRIG